MEIWQAYLAGLHKIDSLLCHSVVVPIEGRQPNIVVTVLHVYKSRLMRVKPHWFEPIVLLLPSYLFLAWQEQLAGHTSSFQHLTFPIVFNPHGAPESSLG